MSIPYDSFPVVADGEALVFREFELRYVGPRFKSERIHSSCSANALLRKLMILGPRETFFVLLLDIKTRPCGYYRFSGSLEAIAIAPVDIFRAALAGCAHSILLAHNHPSGDPSPSQDDIVLTKRIRKAGDLLGIRVLDHIILGDDEHFSFLEKGLLTC